MPLAEERTRRADNQDAVGATSGYQLGEDEAGLDGLAEPDAVREEEARARHAERTHHGHELVRLDRDAPGLRGDECRVSEGLIEEKGLVVEAPGGDAPRLRGVKLAVNGFHLLEWIEHVEFAAAEALDLRTQPDPLLHSGGLDVDDLPERSSSIDLCARDQADARGQWKTGGGRDV
jgi:hypothetical protein